MELPQKTFPRVHPFHFKLQPICIEYRADEFRIVQVILEMEYVNWRIHGALCSYETFLIVPGGGSLMAAQKTPTSETAFTKALKSTGLTTYALTPRL